MEKIAMSVMKHAQSKRKQSLSAAESPNMTPYTKTMKTPSTPLGKPVK